MSLLTWDMLKSNNTVPFRTLGIQRAYDVYRQRLRDQGKTINTALAELLPWKEDKFYVITRNRFPYAVEPPIQHYVIWFHPTRLGRRNLTHNDVAIAVRESWPTAKRGIAWRINPPSQMSVSGIPHAQLFVHPERMQRPF